MRLLLSVVTLASVVAGCATRPARPTAPAVTAPPVTAVPAPTPPAAPFTNRELIEELERQGLGGPAPDKTPPRPPGVGRAVPELPAPSIRETDRGVVVLLPQARFEFDRADLHPEARQAVDRMAIALTHPRALERKIVLEGHADAIGTDAYNVELSRRRAETVAQELIASGVRSERVTIKAYGRGRPVAPNKNPDGSDNPTGRAQNRRVEAVIQN